MKHLLFLLLPLLIYAQKATVTQLFSVQTVKVQKKEHKESQVHYGYVALNDANVYHVTPRFGAFVTKLYANKKFMYVKKGDKLANVYSPEVYKAKEDYLNSYLYTRGRTDKGMLESAKLKLLLLGVNTREIKNVLKYKKVSQNTTIYAKRSGFIFYKDIYEGSAFNAKKKLFEIVDLKSVWVEIYAPQTDLRFMKEAKIHEITTPEGETLLSKSSTYLYPTIDKKEANYKFRIELKNPQKNLYDGMYVKISSAVKSKSILFVPATAIIRKDAKLYAFIVGEFEGEYEPLEVQAKLITPNTYEVIQGLKEGDEVVNNALFLMDSDAQINSLY